MMSRCYERRLGKSQQVGSFGLKSIKLEPSKIFEQGRNKEDKLFVDAENQVTSFENSPKEVCEKKKKTRVTKLITRTRTQMFDFGHFRGNKIIVLNNSNTF